MRLENLVIRWLGVRPRERKHTALLFAYLFLATFFVILGRNARDTLYLSRSGVTNLPWMYVGIALATAAATGLYSRVVAWRAGLYDVLQGTLLLVVWFLIVVRVMVSFQWAPVYPLFYIGMEVAGSLVVLQFWTFVNESFDSREAKRLFGIIGSGGIIGAVCGGFAGSFLVRWVDVVDLLMVCGCVLLLCALLVAAVKRLVEEQPERHATSRLRPAPRGLLESVTQSRYTVFLAAMAVLLTVAVNLVDYQFKLEARARFDEAELAQLFGLLYGVCGLLSFGFHFFFTGRILMRLGILLPLVALPASLILGATTLIVWPALFLPLLLTKGADMTFRYSLHDSVAQLLYIPLPVPLRRRLKAAIDGAVKPAAIALGGGLLLVTGPLNTQTVGLIILVLLGGWMLAALQVRQGYSRALMESLTQGQRLRPVVASLNDVASVRALVEAMRSPDEETVCAALDLLPRREGLRWMPHVLPLLGAPRARVRRAALRWVERERVSIPTGRLEALLADPDPAVRASAVAWFGGRGGADADGRLMTFLRDPIPQVRATAAEQLVSRGGDWRLKGLEALQVLGEAPDATARRWAAWGLGEARVAEGAGAVLTLLGDEDVEVRRAAVEAAGKLAIEDLRAPLLRLLADREVGAEAAQALARHGTEVLPSLLEALDAALHDDVWRFHLLQALRGVGGLPAVEALLSRLPEDGDARQDLLRAAYAMLRPAPAVAVPFERVREPLMRELRECYEIWAILADLGQGGPWTLLRDALHEELDRSRRRMFLILALAYPTRSVSHLYRALESGQRGLMANAIEVLEETVDRGLWPFLVPLLEEGLPEERLERQGVRLGVVRRGAIEWLGVLVTSPRDRWVRICALWVAGMLGERGLRPEMERVLDSGSDPVERETALAALLRLGDPVEVDALRRRYQGDAAPQVRSLALSGLVAVRSA